MCNCRMEIVEKYKAMNDLPDLLTRVEPCVLQLAQLGRPGGSRWMISENMRQPLNIRLARTERRCAR